jgi:hypothetical protein
MLVHVGMVAPLEADNEELLVASRLRSKSVEETAAYVAEMLLLLVTFENEYPLMIAD